MAETEASRLRIAINDTLADPESVALTTAQREQLGLPAAPLKPQIETFTLRQLLDTLVRRAPI